MANKILHCGRKLPVENRYAVSNYPGPGDMTYFDYASCRQCKHPVHAFYHVYFQQDKSTVTAISDKDNRHIFQEFIESGRALLVLAEVDNTPKKKRPPAPRPRTQILACEWTLQTSRPADQSAFYLARNERAPYVTDKATGFLRASDVLQEKREAWFSDYRRAKRGKAGCF